MTTMTPPSASSSGPDPPPDPASDPDQLITSHDPHHPANLIPALCAKFWTLGWVTGTGGGCSIRQDDLVYIAPSGVQKELMKNTDIYVLSLSQRTYLRSPPRLKPSQCTPLFLAAFTRRRAGCCIHTHSQSAVLVTLLLEAQGSDLFEINNIEQIKAFPSEASSSSVVPDHHQPAAPNLGFHDTLTIPVIENTPHEEDLTSFLEDAMDRYPDTCAVLVRRHGVYVWGDDVRKAKTQAESLDYLFQLAVEMKKLAIPWISQITRIGPHRP
ncbi:hypothetical protein L249_6809 [Ophiocordyceps polyrhachis-furcata BCC 54312]|uniref:Methylthioribulose-1-phosphate dehydratase n=1 Tax=Ophiocordyceps polyrhachis-furcata BCC 54312 TaxID=1330021 RepID=A0A367LLD7_9HYPO|nr:hypothetical protein L249_6809 [Ophiocordyceps polyrhachis-furcata BCC 54312]